MRNPAGGTTNGRAGRVTEWRGGRSLHLAAGAASLAVISIACARAASAQSDPALRSPAPTAQTTIASLVFPSPPPATVKDGFVYAVLGDISQVRPVTGLALPEFEN
ncbi:MAG TPA: hypothetical protein VHE78_06420, partial [Gemmatimonadaceae bacterium]|nr:hypothetical protein [Gemmatimonadaceae bacterium]